MTGEICTCEVSAEELDEADRLAEAERLGLEPGHEHCPDCGCDPEDHTLHTESCRRVGQATELQCGPPWKTWPEGGTG